MVQAPDNKATIVARLGEQVASPSGPGFVGFDVELLDAAPVDDWPNLFASRRGHHVIMSVREDLASTLQLGTGLELRCQARLVSIDHAVVESECAAVD
jgi:hypothetical protein